MVDDGAAQIQNTPDTQLDKPIDGRISIATPMYFGRHEMQTTKHTCYAFGVSSHDLPITDKHLVFVRGFARFDQVECVNPRVSRDVLHLTEHLWLH